MWAPHLSAKEALQTEAEHFVDCVLRGTHAHSLEQVALFQWEDGADWDETFGRLRLVRHRRNELQIEDAV